MWNSIQKLLRIGITKFDLKNVVHKVIQEKTKINASLQHEKWGKVVKKFTFPHRDYHNPINDFNYGNQIMFW